MGKWQPKDVIAGIIIIGGVYLLATGVNHWVGATLLAIVGAYYGIDLTPFIKLGRNQKEKEDK